MNPFRPILAACLLALAAPAAQAQAQDEYPFIGRWDCEVGVFTFTDETYNNGGEDLPIEEIQEGTDGSYTLIFADDYTIGLSGFTGDRMGWFSPESGDSFQCKRLEDE